MKNGFATAVIVAGALLVALALSGFAHATTTYFGNIPVTSGSSYSASGQSPLGNCNTAVAHYDSNLGDCVYNSAYYNQQELNWIQANPGVAYNDPSNTYNKYQSYTVNGVQYNYNTPADNPVYYTNYNAYNPAGSTSPYYYTNAPAVTSAGSAFPNTYTSGAVNDFSTLYGSGAGAGSVGSAINVGTNDYANSGVDFGSGNSFDVGNTNSFNNIVDSYNTNTNNYISGYNGLGSNSPYYAGSYGYYPSSDYCVTCSGYSAYSVYAPYYSSTYPSSYFYYWSS